MSTLLSTAAEFLVLGVVTAATAFCVIVLYPAFLARLARQVSEDPSSRSNPRVLGLFGVLVSLGVVAFMALAGLLFTYLLEESLTRIVGVVSPVAFGFLLLVGVLLMLDVKVSRQVRPLSVGNPYLDALLYGFLFGAVVIPCNPGVIALAFARASVIPLGERMTAFLAFGLGIASPLLLFSLISRGASRWMLSALVEHKRLINRVAGAFMSGVSIYYLAFVFEVQKTVAGWLT